jgi:multidrug efflux pump subunit AcrA (membrane-fusion protein)
MMDHLRTINSFLRTLLAIMVVGGLATTGWYGYTTFNAREIAARQQAQARQAAEQALADTKSRLQKSEQDLAGRIAELNEKNARITELQAHLDKLQTALRLLKLDHRLARLTVADQTTDPATGQTSTLIEFVELNDEGHPIETPRQWRLAGDVVFLDSWLVKFDDKYIEHADLERGTSLVLFRRIFSERQQPSEGYPLDEVGSAPRAYARGGKMSDFERHIWDDFWAIANDPAKADELGIRAAHGQAVSMKVQKGRSYRVELRASDGLSIVPERIAAEASR